MKKEHIKKCKHNNVECNDCETIIFNNGSFRGKLFQPKDKWQDNFNDAKYIMQISNNILEPLGLPVGQRQKENDRVDDILKQQIKKAYERGKEEGREPQKQSLNILIQETRRQAKKQALEEVLGEIERMNRKSKDVFNRGFHTDPYKLGVRTTLDQIKSFITKK